MKTVMTKYCCLTSVSMALEEPLYKSLRRVQCLLKVTASTMEYSISRRKKT